MSSDKDPVPGVVGVRERHVNKTVTINEETKEIEVTVDDDSSSEEDATKDKKAYGRTPDGTIFTVPQTHDMVSQLLDPRQPKNLSDVFVLAILALHLLALYLLPAPLKQPVFAVTFLFWRACYNVGIGYLLRIQSNHRRLVAWAKKWSLFVNPKTGKNPRPWLYNLLKIELETKIPEDYKFEEAPIEYNTWLVFRRVVDLILMCDFTSYCLFAIACGHRPEGEDTPGLLIRWVGGILAVLFNLWVKLDAHRVVKDYAWYWGDFFYLIDCNCFIDVPLANPHHAWYRVLVGTHHGLSLGMK